MRGSLAPEMVLGALPVLQAEGYGTLSLSGGEPLLYSGVEEVIRGAAKLGFRVNLITNGAPVGGRMLDLIAESVGTVAISLDGAAERHNEIRGDARAFEWAERAVDRLRARKVPFGIAFGVSRESICEMPWAVEFAESKGAALVQFHPFAPTGRGRHMVERMGLSDADKARVFFIAGLLDSGEAPAVHLDLMPIETARDRQNDYPILRVEEGIAASLSDLVNPLVIDEGGIMSPFGYGVNGRFAMGRLGADLGETIAAYKQSGWRDLRRLVEASFSSLEGGRGRFVDWFYHLVETSNRMSEEGRGLRLIQLGEVHACVVA